MSTRTAVVLVGSVVLVLTILFAALVWAFGGRAELLPFAALLVLTAAVTVLTRGARRR